MSNLIEDVTRLFHEQATADRKVVSRDDLPHKYEAITPEWLTAILCAGHAEARVAALTLGKADDGFCNRRRIFVEYNDAGRQAGLPATVFCKACHDLTSRIAFAVTGVGATEANFYNHARDRLDIETTCAYFARSDPQTMNAIVVMRDERNANFFDIDTDVDRARAAEMMRLLAGLHATFYQPENAALASRYFSNYAELWDRFTQLGAQERCREGLAAARAVVAPGVFARADDVWPAMVAAALRHREQPRTLTHGDGHLKNWYLTGLGRLGLNDWQAATVGAGVRDVAYILTTALTVADRRAWERELLAVYAEALNELGGTALSPDALWHDYRGQIASCLSTWTFQYKQPLGETSVHPDSIKTTYVSRITQAMDDLKSLDALLD